jgi:hypothetical protein
VVGEDVFGQPVSALAFLPLVLEKLLQFGVKEDRPALIVFGRPRIQTDNTGFKVNLSPCQIGDLVSLFVRPL